MPDPSCRFRISNHSATDIVLVTEPWGMEHPLPAGKGYDVVVTGDLAQACEIEWRPDCVVVYAAVGPEAPTLAVYDGDRRLP